MKEKRGTQEREYDRESGKIIIVGRRWDAHSPGRLFVEKGRGKVKKKQQQKERERD